MSRLTAEDPRSAAAAQGSDELPLRFVTAASLFDGHDAAINVMRRLIQDSGAEVVHLGHNRSVRDVVRAAIQEDADGIAISSYQGGHTEYFKYAVEMLSEAGADHIRVFGGGGGTITPEEIADLEGAGVERIYHPNDGMNLGLVGMIDDLVARARSQQRSSSVPDGGGTDDLDVAKMLSALEDGVIGDDDLDHLRADWTVKGAGVPVVGVTGTGGAGKSTVTDELLGRFVQHLPDLRIAVLAVDPTRRRTGGALLGDRIRMNSLRHEQLYMRSMATRRQNLSTSAVLADAVAFLKAAEFDLVIVETAGIGQSDSEIVDLVDLPIYVMTSEFGAASQLEKIDMLDLAEIVVINKFDKQGAADALRDVRNSGAATGWSSSCRTTRCRCTRRSPRSSPTPASPGPS
jgi:methylmalonyl-CoA mutase